MALSIKNTKAEELVTEVVKETGETKTEAIIHSLEDRLQKLRGRKMKDNFVEKIMEISKRCAALPTLDPRTPDEILGYNEKGTFD
ncbi:MAG: hypothetical protein A3G32_06690 [Deltaproteobacteria bacterium RIFCSPLOWO2_12_FULL_40_28]|nr:MAG: hypothetical protein A3C45_02785 [Deltaproteobacteria bacterium RIFCSPHIGHO2_02_FULL_40_28]OGQ19134.1 MAG: hypothetical protein A3E27_05875 [Deltaproteobacteria bacterium RIFCSPHIGHO2_12_FULL_40_32]OGQ40306.1 MAG: hypothetical protein A3I69_01315 [Deltaproteobacteria bacterium RIFCSPLOWO2_02_FULL_40_36]OGQ53577.1 MAG: hypothetical protein A3G32_06690 [Deltaproteobacteria bacterium RIFCSPLOWO2_12_FULL_40_28]